MCKVKCSTADIFDSAWLPVFAYHREYGLIYGIPNREEMAWNIFRNGEYIETCKSGFNNYILTHPYMLKPEEVSKIKRKPSKVR